MKVLSFCCLRHLGRFGKATFWDVGFELEDLERRHFGMQVLSLCYLRHLGTFGKATI